jgi:hypothetical protein
LSTLASTTLINNHSTQALERVEYSLGAAVVGLAVVGLAVHGAAVVGFGVTGAAVVGAGVAVGDSNRTHSVARSDQRHGIQCSSILTGSEVSAALVVLQSMLITL